MHDERSDERSENNKVAYDRTEWNCVDIYKWRWDYSHMHDERSENNKVAYDRTEWNCVDIYKWVVGLLAHAR
jgi:hypothetical protein